MATVHSLVCWGGRTGKVVTMTIASPCVVTSTNHGLRNGGRLVFSTTGALPTGITAGVTYYAKSTAANTFNLYDTKANAIAGGTTGRINTSGSQSGTHTAKSVLMLEYFTQYAGRWGDPGGERCYDGLISWHTARTSVVLGVDEEVCELGEAFTEMLTGAAHLTVGMNAGAVRIEPRVNGVITEAFHYGNVSAATASGVRYGFVFEATNPGANISMLTLLSRNAFAEGFTVARLTSHYTVTGVVLNFGAVAMRMISVSNYTVSGAGFAVSGTGPGAVCKQCLSMGWGSGFSGPQTVEQYGFYDCIATKNGTGFFSSTSNSWLIAINNISLGNTTNWSVSTGHRLSTNNLGGTGEAWMTSGGSRIEVTESSPFSSVFVDWANNDLRPASASSPQVDAGVEYYTALNYDIAFNERPNYNNGGPEGVDIGPYEFDNGFGPHPITASLTLTGLISGTDVVVREAGTSTILDSVDSTSGSWSYTYGAAHNVDIDVIKPGMVIVTFRNLALTAESSTLPVSQQFDRNYQ